MIELANIAIDRWQRFKIFIESKSEVTPTEEAHTMGTDFIPNPELGNLIATEFVKRLEEIYEKWMPDGPWPILDSNGD